MFFEKLVSSEDIVSNIHDYESKEDEKSKPIKKLPIRKGFSKDEAIFFINLKGRYISRSTPVDDIQQTMDSLNVTKSDYYLFEDYKNCSNNSKFMKELEKRGKFTRTYRTEKKYVDAYAKTLGGEKIFYNVDESSAADSKAAIARLYYFYETLMGLPIPEFKIDLSEKQAMIVKQRKGITVVNSGPGTGKTTVAVKKMVELMNEGVIGVSFTNVTVDNMHQKILNFITDYDNVSKGKYDKKIVLSTIDAICALPFPKDQKGKNMDFSMLIEMAKKEAEMTAIKGNMVNNQKEMKFKHLIIDEAQDIDDSRFEFLRLIYESCEFESMTIIGDPRQRLNTHAGGIYQDLVTKGKENIDEADFTFDKPFLVNCSETYRFKNPLLLDLANSLSELRPPLHAQLNYASPEISEKKKIQKIRTCDEVVEKISILIENGVSPSEICFISPIVDKHKNQNCIIYETIRQNLLTRNIPVSNKTECGSVYHSSIQSVKGLEFDYVFFIGSSSFPSYMMSVYGDINDGISMLYVANTRARKELFYIVDNTSRLPDYVDEAFVEEDFIDVKPRIQEKEKYYTGIKTEDIEFCNYEKTEETMRTIFSIPRKNMELGFQPIPNYKYELMAMLLFDTKAITTMQSKDLLNKSVPQQDFYEATRSCILYDLRSTTKRERIAYTGCMKGEIATFRKKCVENLNECENMEMINMFVKLMTGKDSVLTSTELVSNAFMKIKSLLDNQSTYEQNIIGYKIYASTIENNENVFIFTDCTYLALYAKKINPSKIVYMISLSKGQVYEIGKPIYSLKRYQYQLEFLYSLFCHFKLMGKSSKFSLACVNRAAPDLAIDTEYITRTANKSNAIYEISVINLFDPFKSIATYLRCHKSLFNTRSNPYAPSVGDMELYYDDFINCPTYVDFKLLFDEVYSSKKPTIYYYSASQDLAIFYENDELFLRNIYESRKPVYNHLKETSSEKVAKVLMDLFGGEGDTFADFFIGDQDYSDLQKNMNSEEQEELYRALDAIQTGSNKEAWKYSNCKEEYDEYSFINFRDGNGGLSNNYMQQTNRNIIDMKHIIPHKAFCDTLMLIEMVAIDKYSFKK